MLGGHHPIRCAAPRDADRKILVGRAKGTMVNAEGYVIPQESQGCRTAPTALTCPINEILALHPQLSASATIPPGLHFAS